MVQSAEPQEPLRVDAVSSWRTDDEVLREYRDCMGNDLGELFHALAIELTLDWRWAQHRVLFGASPTRIDMLNQAAPLFFRLVQDVFTVYSIKMSASRS